MPIENHKTLYSELLSKIKGAVFKSEPMSLHTSFRIGGPADLFILPKNLDDLVTLYEFANNHGIPVCLIGQGSNLLISDLGFHGIVIQMQSNWNQIRFTDNILTVESGVLSQRLLQEALAHRFIGLDFLSGIPGSIGGCTFMNAGSNQRSISDVIVSAEVFNTNTMKIETFLRSDFQFQYRSSVLHENHFVVLSIRLELSEGDSRVEKEKIRTWKEKRISSQPLQYPNAGCIWKNPDTISAGKLIESAGLKGYQIGEAQISRLHGNFIINTGKATAMNVFDVINHTEETIYKQFGIQLIREIQLIGEF